MKLISFGRTVFYFLLMTILLAMAPAVTNAALDEGSDEVGNELPICELITWSDGGGSFSCVDDSKPCVNVTGGGSCVATQLNAVLEAGGELSIIGSDGNSYTVDKTNIVDSPFAGSSLSLDVISADWLATADPTVMQDPFSLFSPTLIEDQVPEILAPDFGEIWDSGFSAFNPDLILNNVPSFVGGISGLGDSSSEVPFVSFTGFNGTQNLPNYGLSDNLNLITGFSDYFNTSTIVSTIASTPVIGDVADWVSSIAGEVLGGTPADLPGIRNNNPGNLKCDGTNWNGMTGCSSQGFVTFESAEYGLRAAIRSLANQTNNHGIDNIEDLITKYSTTDQAPYIEFVARHTGISLEDNFDLNDPNTNLKILGAILAFENAGNVPYTPEQIAEAYRLEGRILSGTTPSVGEGTSSGGNNTTGSPTNPLDSTNLDLSSIPGIGAAVSMISSMTGSGNIPGGSFASSLASGMLDIAAGNSTGQDFANDLFGPQIQQMEDITGRGFDANTIGDMFGVVGGLLGSVMGFDPTGGGIIPSSAPVAPPIAVNPTTSNTPGILVSTKDSDAALSATEASVLLQLNGIEMKEGVSGEGARVRTIAEIAELDRACGCNVLVTSITDGIHEEGTHSHGAGYKFDVRTRDNPQVLAYVESLPSAGPDWNDGTKIYRDPNRPGVVYAVEDDHLDVLVAPVSGGSPSGGGGSAGGSSSGSGGGVTGNPIVDAGIQILSNILGGGSSPGSSSSGGGSSGITGGGGGGGSGSGGDSGGKGGSPTQPQQPSISCSPDSIVEGTPNQSIRLIWNCSGTRATSEGIGFSTGGAAYGDITITAPTTDASYLNYGVSCGGAQAMCRVDVR